MVRQKSCLSKNPESGTRRLQKNIQTLDASRCDRCASWRCESEFLRDAAKLGEFDIVFLDPPFAADMLGDLCRLLDEASVLARGALVYIEEDRARPEVGTA